MTPSLAPHAPEILLIENLYKYTFADNKHIVSSWLYTLTRYGAHRQPPIWYQGDFPRIKTSKKARLVGLPSGRKTSDWRYWLKKKNTLHISGQKHQRMSSFDGLHCTIVLLLPKIMWHRKAAIVSNPVPEDSIRTRCPPLSQVPTNQFHDNGLRDRFFGIDSLPLIEQ